MPKLVTYTFKLMPGGKPFYVVMPEEERDLRPREVLYENGPRTVRLNWQKMTARFWGHEVRGLA